MLIETGSAGSWLTTQAETAKLQSDFNANKASVLTMMAEQVTAVSLTVNEARKKGQQN